MLLQTPGENTLPSFSLACVCACVCVCVCACVCVGVGVCVCVRGHGSAVMHVIVYASVCIVCFCV